MISDIMGIGLGGAVARFANRLGLPTATLTLDQTTLRSVRWSRQFGATVGVVIGCLIGMFPLLLMDQRQTEKRKRRQRLERIMATAVLHIGEVIEGESATLFVVDHEHDELWTHASKELERDVRVPLQRSLAGRCASTGMPLIVNDVYKDPDFNPAVDRDRGTKTRNAICSPVFDGQGQRVIGVVEVVNKRGGAAEKGFGVEDERALASMGPHIALALETVSKPDDELDEAARFLEALKTAAVHHARRLRFESERDG